MNHSPKSPKKKQTSATAPINLRAKKEALVLYSGGLDSRLAIKLLLDQGFSITALYFNLPFGCGCCNRGCNTHFTQTQLVKLEIVDVCKEPLLSQYLKLVHAPKHGTGTGINPCRDCKIFMFSLAKKIADKRGVRVIATGEVLGQRPMSQVSNSMKVIDERLGFEILRPLSAKKLPITSFEKEGLVDRDKLLGIHGRTRKEQMRLAKEYKIQYPSPSGGCFLCEKKASFKLLKLLNEKQVTEKTLPLTMLGRHFYKDNCWVVIARDAGEGTVIMNSQDGPNILAGSKGFPTVFYSREKGKLFAKELQEAYATGVPKSRRSKFSEWRL